MRAPVTEPWNKQTSYTNNLFQSQLSPPDPDQSADFEARYTNPAYSFRPPSAPSEFQMSLGGPLQAHMPAAGIDLRAVSSLRRVTRPANALGALRVRKQFTLAAGQDRDEQEFAKALELLMDDNSIQNALEAFAQSCSQHSRDLRSVQLAMLTVLS